MELGEKGDIVMMWEAHERKFIKLMIYVMLKDRQK